MNASYNYYALIKYLRYQTVWKMLSIMIKTVKEFINYFVILQIWYYKYCVYSSV